MRSPEPIGHTRAGLDQVVFDADGVIVDTLSAAMEAQRRILQLFGVDADIRKRSDMRREFSPHALEERLGRRAAAVAGELHPLVMRTRLLNDSVPKFIGVIDVARRLPEPPRIITASFADAVAAALGAFRDVFGPIVGREHGRKLELMRQLSEEIGRYSYVCDTKRDVERCAQLGLRAIGVSWGYDSTAALLDAGCHQVVSDPSDLGRLIRLDQPSARRHGP